MEGLNPALQLALELRRSVEGGESPRTGLKRFAGNPGEFPSFCRRWLERRDRGGAHMELLKELKSPYRRSLMVVLEKGLSGEPVQATLLEMEKELERACLEEIERHLALLPFRLMVPLLLFLFPAMMILILSPLLDLLSRSFSQ
ncbi:MAG TPA: hypothetical protein PL182_02605 [Pseudobdellovibrionaceae bacterium]|mgnify:CR=1 FL=1|nr:hypothetical protein [Pseudobdellovibrionaceae bacterium]